MTACLIPLLSSLAAGPGDGPRPAIAPTMVRLDFEDKSLGEIVDLLNRRGPNRVEIAPEPTARGIFVRPDAAKKPAPPPPRFRVVEPEALPFWEAMDRLGQATATRATVGPWGKDDHVTLWKAVPGRGFATNDGAARVTLDAVSYGRAVTCAPDFYPGPGRLSIDRPRLGDRTTFTASLTLVLEPRLKIRGVEGLTTVEATDDRGRSLLIPGEAGLRPTTHDTLPSSAVHLAVPLRLPDEPGATIKRLRGTIRFLATGLPAPGPSEREAVVDFDFADVPMP